MALVVGTNSYVTEEEAITYFADRFNGSDWEGIEDVDDELYPKLLVSATDILDSAFSWLNSKTDSDQLLEFPRNNETTVPQKIKNATFELALEIYLSEGALQLDNPKLIKTDKVTTEWTPGSNQFPESIKNIVKDYGYYRSSTDVRTAFLQR